MTKKSVWCVAALLGVLGSLVSRADDSQPPCWRGYVNTTYQSWVFTVSNNPAAPEMFTNPNAMPQAAFTIGPFGKGWLATSFGGKTGLWELGQAGQVSVSVSNYAGFGSAPKYLQVQVTYFEAGGIYLAPTVSIAGATLVSSQTVNNLSAAPGLWRTQITRWLVTPAPASETILITGSPTKGLLIDQIVVDTKIASGGDGDVPAFQPCWRGATSSTFQHWAFGVSNNLAAVPAELATNVFGFPQASIAPGAFSSGFILEDTFLGCRQGIWDLGQSGTMTLDVPNAPGLSGSSYKYVQVAVTQLRDGIYVESAAVGIAGGTLVNQQEINVETNGFGGVWVVAKSLWRLGPPSPGMETVVLTGGTNGSLIDQVVIDTVALDFPCPTDLVASADSGQCGKANVTWPVVAVDGCVVTNVVSVPALGSTFAVGTNPVTCVVYDRYGGTHTCNFTVTITDDEAPVIICPTNIVVARDPAQCGAVVNFAPLATDNCSGATVVVTPPSGSLFPPGLTTVTAVAYDAASNSSAPCNFTVQVIDFAGDLAVFQPCWRGSNGSTFAHWAFAVSNPPTALSAESVANIYGVPGGAINVGPFSSGYIESDMFLGCRQGIWDSGQSGTMNFTIPNAPGLSGSSYKYVQVAVTQYRDGIYQENAAVSISGATLVEVQSQDIETNLFGGLWVVEKTLWRVGPPSPVVETIVLTGGTNGSLIDQVVVDTLALDFACPTDLVASADAGQCSKSNVTWNLPLVDGCVVTNVVSVPANGSTFVVGTNPVTCVVYDRYGGMHACNFSVAITDDELPNAICKNITVNLDALGNAVITGGAVDDGSSDNCGIASLSVLPSTFTCANIGSNAVVLTVADVHGQISTCNAVVTVLDNLPPSFVCPGAITNVADIGVCSATFVLPPLLASDNCGIASISSNAPASFPTGITPVTWEVVDVNANTNSCVQLVVIVDDQLPQMVCPANFVTNATVDCSQVVSWPDPVTMDNCAVTNLVTVPPSGSVFPVGNTVVNCTVWDASGNSNTCSFTVTVTATADLALSINATPNPVTLGSNVVYSITISNAGPCAATGVAVSNFLSVGQVALMATNQSNPGMANPFPGPVAWWQAEGNATDLVGGNNGTGAGGVSYVAGTVGQSFNFDGTTGSVSVPDAPALRPQSLTIEGWIKIHDVTGVHVIIGKRLGAGTSDSYSMWIGSGVLFASMADNLGSGPFLTYPEFPTFSFFKTTDLVDLQSFAYKLQPANPADLVSWFIKTNLSPTTTALLAAYVSGPDLVLQQRLVQDLNSIITNGSIYEATRFGAVTLSPETQYILGRNPLGPDLVRLNRFLIRDAYSAEFAATVFPQLNQWFHVAYTFDAGTQVQTLYVNGVLVNAGFVNKTIAYDSHPLLIGADDDNGSPGYFYQGEIDEITLYDRALTGAEIKGVFQAANAGKCAVAGTVSVGTIPSGATAEVSFVAMATNCSPITADAVVSAATADLNLVNNAAAAGTAVQELPPSEWLLGIERVSVNNDLLRISWPLACGGLSLETTTNLVAPIIWTPAIVPIQLIDQRQTTIIPAAEPMRYFRAVTP
jgi:uncharacterized repeat protein (TIGR01451 family)